MKYFIINGQEFEACQAEEVEPVLLAALVAECAKRNNTNSQLKQINHNTWVKINELPIT